MWLHFIERWQSALDCNLRDTLNLLRLWGGIFSLLGKLCCFILVERRGHEQTNESDAFRPLNCASLALHTCWPSFWKSPPQTSPAHLTSFMSQVTAFTWSVSIGDCSQPSPPELTYSLSTFFELVWPSCTRAEPHGNNSWTTNICACSAAKMGVWPMTTDHSLQPLSGDTGHWIIFIRTSLP